MTEAQENEVVWHNPDEPPFRLSGFAWYETDKAYRRLPLKPSHTLPEAVGRLANNTSGGQIAFRSDAKKIMIRVKLYAAGDMDHMPATGQCGFDIYTGSPGEQRFYTVTRFNHRSAEYECLMFEHGETEMRNFTLNFPLYQGVKKVEIGLPASARINPPPPYALDGRIVFYGTSITQGGCASRPGMSYANILSRALNVEVINLGFSGSGRGEPEVAHVVSQVESPRMFVLDYEANQGDYDKLKETMQEFVRILRARHSEVPILVISRTAFARDFTHEEQLHHRLKNASMQKEIVEGAREAGDANIYFVDGSTLLGSDAHECTVDGVHATDLGFMRMARALEPTLRQILKLP